MIDRANAEAVKYRIATMALSYYPDRPQAELGYSVDEDLQWCLQPVLDLPPAEFASVLEVARDVIIDPTTHREHLTAVLAQLTAGGERDEP